MRIGFFGGSFDPPHLGHRAIARAAADAFSLDQVLWTPAGLQPLKIASLSASFADRLAMVSLAAAGETRFVASALDAPRADGVPNYTVDTLLRLRHQAPGADVFGIIGVDAYLDLSRWREPARLFELAEWIVITRPGYPATLPPPSTVPPPDARRVHWLATVLMDLSATTLRKRLGQGLPCGEWIAPPVLDYIAQHGLYGCGKQAVSR